MQERSRVIVLRDKSLNYPREKSSGYHFLKGFGMPLPLISENIFIPPRGQTPKYPPDTENPVPLDLSSQTLFTQGQPFDAFAKMRSVAPVMWHELPEGGGFWALTGYREIKSVDLDSEIFSSQYGGFMMNYEGAKARHPKLFSAALDCLIALDAPYHMPLRMAHMACFRPDYITRLRRKVEVKVGALLDDMAKAGPVLDMVPAFSAELPLFTLSEILGIPEADRPRLVRWMHYLELANYTLQDQPSEALDPDLIMTFLSEVQAMFDYGQTLLRSRRATPRDDLLSAIANAEVDGALLPEEFLDGSWLLIVFAGNDTTRNSLSGTMRLLTEYPDQKRKLCRDSALFANFLHEALRMVSPVIYMGRTTLEDTRIGEQRIGAGERVMMFYGAANRDPSVFAEPDCFDIARENASEHLAFGIGPHVCLGKQVALMQLDVAYRQILARFPAIEWTGKSTIAPNNFVHAISSLEVDLGLE